MDSTNLKDFRPDPPDFDDEELSIEQDDAPPIESSGYHEEINTLKIDKLSNRVTIISIIIPCLIGAILIFAYLDIKERVVDVDTTKQSQYEKISRQLEEKLNALDVKIAKNRYDIDDTLPGLKKKSVALEGQLTKKADAKTIKSQITKLEKRVSKNAKQSTTMNTTTLAALKETRDRFDNTAKQIKDEITLFKDEFDARLLELSEYEQQIGILRKNFSLLDKKQKNMSQEYISKTSFDQHVEQTKIESDVRLQQLEAQVKALNTKMSATISKFQDDLDFLMKVSKTRTNSKPSPQTNVDSPKSSDIKTEPLKQ